MDFGRAFSFVFKDTEWVKKVLLGGVISLIPLIGGFVVYGYAIEVLRRAYQDDDALPEWNDFGGYLVRGFVAWVGALIWAIPIFVIFGCAFIPAAILSGDSDTASNIFFGIGYCLAAPLALVYGVAVLPIVIGRYAVERNFGAMFNFNEVFAEIRRAGTQLLMLLLVIIVAGLISQLGILACFIGVLFTSFYAQLAMAHAAGQVYRRARGLSDPSTVAPAF